MAEKRLKIVTGLLLLAGLGLLLSTLCVDLDAQLWRFRAIRQEMRKER